MAYNSKTKMYEGYIYLLTNVINNHQYVGQTFRTVEDRMKEHKRDCKKFDYAIYRAFDKYGIENFIVQIIDTLYAKTKKQISQLLDEKEIYWIAFYDTFHNGYNETIGGQNNAPNRFPERPVIEYNLYGDQMDIYPSLVSASEATGFSRSDISSCCQRKKIHRVQNKIFRYQDSPLTDEETTFYRNRYPKILQYDGYGKLINTYDFMSDAEKYLQSQDMGAYVGNISKCCKGKVLSVCGYVWRMYPDTFDTYKIPSIKKIEQRDRTTGELIYIFDNYDEIRKLLKINDTAQISQCCNGYSNTTFGYHWCFEGEFDISRLCRTRSKQIDQYDMEGNYIATYDSCTDAVKAIGLTSTSAVSSISEACRGKKKSMYGFIWKYSYITYNFTGKEDQINYEQKTKILYS